MKVYAYAICRNEEKNVARWIAATCDCDFRLVVDTGSTDRSVELLRAAGITVIEKRWDPFRFDVPRNFAIAQLPSGSDWLISPDFDEYFETGWREKLEEIHNNHPQATRVSYPVQFHRDGQITLGLNPGLKIHKNVYHWEQPVHEYLVFSGLCEEKTIHAPRIVQHHFQDHGKDREEHYFKIALEFLEKDPENEWLTWFALRGSALIRRNPEDTIRYARRYLALSRPYTNFRSFALCELGKALSSRGKISSEVMTCLLRAISEDPTNQEAWLWFARASEMIGDAPAVAFATSRFDGTLDAQSTI